MIARERESCFNDVIKRVHLSHCLRYEIRQFWHKAPLDEWPIKLPYQSLSKIVASSFNSFYAD